MKPNIKPVQFNSTLPKQLLTTKEAAEYLNVSMQTARNLARQNKIPSVKIGHRVYIQLDKFIAKFCE